MKKKLPAPTADLKLLADAGVKHAKLRKDGKYAPRKGKAGASHKVEVAPGSVLLAPKKKWTKHKHPDVPAAPTIPDEPVDETPAGSLQRPVIPAGATHLEYSTTKVAIVEDIRELDSYLQPQFRGRLRFGKLRWNSEFESMMPGEEHMFGAANGVETVVKQGALRRPKAPMAPRAPMAPGSAATAPQAPRPPRIPRDPSKPGVCSVIDALIMEGGRTPEEILALVMPQFPERDPKATLATIKVRPSHIRKRGEVAPPFKK